MDNDEIDYKKAFELLMCATIVKTLAPSSIEPFGGSPDLCIQCIEKGRYLVYGDDGEKKIMCDACPYNITAYKGGCNQ